MQLQAKLAVIGCVTALAASIGAVLAGPAEAIDGQLMCVLNQENVIQCAYVNNPPNSGSVVYVTDMPPNANSWNAPPNEGQISLVYTKSSLCMSVQYGYNANQIVLAPCNGNPQEEWITINNGGGSYVYYNAYYNLCLNDRYYDHYLNAASCNDGANQSFYPTA
jgi:hypothetical protein